MTAQHFEIEIANSYGETSPAQIFCEVEYITENSTTRPLCSIRLNWDTYDFYSMAYDFFALGLKAYKLTLNKKARSADIVDIFDCGSDVEIVAVAEQDRFHQKWLDSVSNLYTEISDQEQ